MTRADLIALAERVEQAQGPDRDLDGLIWDALGLVDEAHCGHWCRIDGRTDLTRADFIRAWAPEFTASLDAALTLYGERPPRLIETDPRRACRDALVWLAEHRHE